MKAKVYIPIIVAAGAAAGLILGLSNVGLHADREQEETTTVLAQETTTKPTETTKDPKIEAEKKKEEEDKKKKEEEKKKAEEEKKKKEEEEAKKKEQEEKDKKTDGASEENKDEGNKPAGQSNDTGTGDDNVEYIYVPVNNYPDYNTNNNSGSNPDAVQTQPAATQHTHSWEAIYKTVHHDARTHKENRKTGTVEYTECTYYGNTYFTVKTEYEQDGFYQVCKLSNGYVLFETNRENDRKEISYFTSLMGISTEDERYGFNTKTEDIMGEVTVTDQEAYDERVFDYYICNGCGQKSY